MQYPDDLNPVCPLSCRGRSATQGGHDFTRIFVTLTPPPPAPQGAQRLQYPDDFILSLDTLDLLPAAACFAQMPSEAASLPPPPAEGARGRSSSLSLWVMGTRGPSSSKQFAYERCSGQRRFPRTTLEPHTKVDGKTIGSISSLCALWPRVPGLGVRGRAAMRYHARPPTRFHITLYHDRSTSRG